MGAGAAQARALVGPDAAELQEQMEALGGIAFAVEAFARATEEQRKQEAEEAMRSAMRSARGRTERSRSLENRRSSLRNIFELASTVQAVKKAAAARPKRGSLEVGPSRTEDGEGPEERAPGDSQGPSDPGGARGRRAGRRWAAPSPSARAGCRRAA